MGDRKSLENAKKKGKVSCWSHSSNKTNIDFGVNELYSTRKDPNDMFLNLNLAREYKSGLRNNFFHGLILCF
jgi:hypothetical protein